MNSDLAIIIPSCDEYVDVVDEFLRYFHMHWSNCPFEVILVTQENEYIKDNSITSITTNKEAKWAERLLKGIEQTKCKYILHMMEDAFIGDYVSNKYVYSIIEFMKLHDIKYYSCSRFKDNMAREASFFDFPNAFRIPRNKPYGVNCLAEIWNRDELKKLIDSGIKTGWDLEYFFLKASNSGDCGYYEDYVRDKHNWLHIVHSIYGGEWTYDTKILEKRGNPVNKGHRKTMRYSVYLKERLSHVANRIIPSKMRKPIKKVMSKIGFSFRSKE